MLTKAVDLAFLIKGLQLRDSTGLLTCGQSPVSPLAPHFYLWCTLVTGYKNFIRCNFCEIITDGWHCQFDYLWQSIQIQNAVKQLP